MAGPLRFSANINTFNACADRYVLSGYGERLNTDQLIQAATKVPRLTGVELVGLWHVNDDNVEQIRRQVTTPASPSPVSRRTSGRRANGAGARLPPMTRRSAGLPSRK